MNVREQSQQETIVRLRAELDRQLARLAELRDRQAARERKPRRRCVYCGDPSYGPACGSHADLLALDLVAPA